MKVIQSQDSARLVPCDLIDSDEVDYCSFTSTMSHIKSRESRKVLIGFGQGGSVAQVATRLSYHSTLLLYQ